MKYIISLANPFNPLIHHDIPLRHGSTKGVWSGLMP